jgi:hypothetical protein
MPCALFAKNTRGGGSIGLSNQIPSQQSSGTSNQILAEQTLGTSNQFFPSKLLVSPLATNHSPALPRRPQLYSQRRRKGSGDFPGLQSRRFVPSRIEWWVRLPHASATVSGISGGCSQFCVLRHFVHTAHSVPKLCGLWSRTAFTPSCAKCDSGPFLSMPCCLHGTYKA